MRRISADYFLKLFVGVRFIRADPWSIPRILTNR